MQSLPAVDLNIRSVFNSRSPVRTLFHFYAANIQQFMSLLQKLQEIFQIDEKK